VRPLLNVKRSPKSPVLLLYEIPPVAEREVSPILLLNVVQSAPVRRPVDVALAFQIAIVTFGQTVEFAPLVMVIAVLVVEIDPNVRADCLELNIFQSVEESAPVVVLLASQIERPVPTRESPLAGVRIERAPCLLLNVVQSVPVSAPVVLALAFQIENTPVVLLYERGQTAERAESPILVATTHEREARLVLVRVRLPERVFTVHERVERFVLVIVRAHESVFTVVERLARFHERVAMFPVAVARFVWRVTMLELTPPRDPERVARFVFVVARDPESVARFPERVAILPVAVARLEFVVARLVVRVAMLPVAVARFESWSVFVPWSFWRAWSRESLAVTVPAAAENPVRRDERDIFPEKAL
jgi:hypothetical protein